MKSRVTGKNQLTIPAVLAKEFNIAAGSEVEWSRGTTTGTICLHVRPSPTDVLRQVREVGATYRTQAGAALRELTRMRDEDEVVRPARKKRTA